MPDQRIRRLRKQIDAADRRLVALLNRRARLSLAIGRRKRELGIPLFIRAREREIARNVRRANRGPLSGRALTQLYADLLRLTRLAVRASLRREREAAGKRRARS